MKTLTLIKFYFLFLLIVVKKKSKFMSFVQRETYGKKEVDLDASYESIRSLIEEYLNEKKSGNLDWIYRYVNENTNADDARNGSPLSAKAKQLISDIMWDLVIENKVRPGCWDNYSKEFKHNFPFFHVSENANLS
ncbi:MAG: hypothetical protein F6K35_14635 [Okeania sp. SIO2H7]|nr:hypothetical protein [Okeania sp. SIO2H7]